MQRLLLILIALLSYNLLSFSDEVLQKNGNITTGRIVSGRLQMVKLRVDTGLVYIPKAEVQSITFSSADIVRLKNNETLECKILSGLHDSVIVLTPTGIREIDSNAIETAFYNLGKKLTVSELPSTGREFFSSGNAAIIAGDFHSNFFISGQITSYFPKIIDQQTPYGLHPSNESLTLGLLHGFGIGYDFNRSISFAIQFEEFANPIIPDGGYEFAPYHRYYYSTIKYARPVTSNLQLLMFGALDLGILQTQQYNFKDGYLDDGVSTTMIAPRVNVGIDYFLMEPDISSSWGIGYLMAARDNSDNTINFIGISFSCRLLYHFRL